MNTPNKITLSRILLIPLVVFFYLATFIPYGKLVAAIIFAVACFTDFLDGYLARKNNQVTDLGKFFDAIADKVLIMTGMILTVAFPIATGVNADGVQVFRAVVQPSWLGIVFIVVMLAREFIISALRQIAAAKGRVLPADKGGKYKAALQDVTVTLYMFYAFYVTEIYRVHQNYTLSLVFGVILIVMLGLSAVLTVWSGASYLIKNKDVFVEKK